MTTIANGATLTMMGSVIPSPIAALTASSASRRTKTMNDMLDVPRWSIFLGLFGIGYMVSDVLFGWF